MILEENFKYIFYFRYKNPMTDILIQGLLFLEFYSEMKLGSSNFKTILKIRGIYSKIRRDFSCSEYFSISKHFQSLYDEIFNMIVIPFFLILIMQLRN